MCVCRPWLCFSVAVPALVHLRALSGDFPFYGKMETEPAEAVQDLKQGGRAVLDETLLLQFGAATGGHVSLGGRGLRSPVL